MADPANANSEKVPAGQLPAWDVGELAPPPRIGWNPLLLIGPGLLMVGAAIGGGEWLMGPAATAKYGGAIMGLATLSILCQVVYNLEVMRYTVYCGEPIFIGFFRLLPGPWFWTFFYIFIDFFAIWPYLSASAAVPLNAVWLGHMPGALPTAYSSVDDVARRTGLPRETVQELADHPKRFSLTPNEKQGQRLPPEPIKDLMQAENLLTQRISYGVFLAAFLPLIFGGKVYNMVEKLMTVKVVVVLAYLVFMGVFFVSPGTWAEVFGGFLCIGKDAGGSWGFNPPVELRRTDDGAWDFFQTGTGAAVDWALLAGFAAIAGVGGLNNSQFSTYARDKGWGMGRLVGAIPSMVGGVGITLSHTGRVFHLNPDSLDRWFGWMKFIRRDQLLIWMTGSFLGMAIPSLLSLEYLRGVHVPNNEVPAATAGAIVERHPDLQILWLMTLLCGFIVLAPTQVTAMDGLIRRWTDVLWTASPYTRGMKGHQVKYIYYALLFAYMLFGLFVLWRLPDPLAMTKVSGVLLNFGLGFSAFHTLVVNRLLLPRELRPGFLRCAGLVACGIFFIGISVLGFNKGMEDAHIYPKLREWGWMQ